jgi:alcohol dehydrogenase, propanol-preferring
MRAWVVHQPGPAAETGPAGPLRLIDRAEPEPRQGELLIRVLRCGVCRTDLHLAEGDLPVRRPQTSPGHEIVGRVDALGAGASRFAVGDRIGIAWLRGTCGRCRYCRRGAENLCPYATFTGWDADGGYAEYATVAEGYAYRLPDRFSDAEAAPLLCAGIVGYRALLRAQLPAGGRLGIYGFGASAHIAAQVAIAQGAEVHVLTRGDEARTLATSLGAASVGGAYDEPPEPLDGAVLFAPVGELVPVALAALDRGGTLSIAGIHLTDIPPLNYEHHLFYERTVQSVTANTRADGEDFLRLADRLGVTVSVTPFPLDQADTALQTLASGGMRGAGVLLPT